MENICKNCGNAMDENTAFCPRCGEKVHGEDNIKEKNARHSRISVNDGEIHRCPNCGEILNSFAKSCPSCGFEIRGLSTSSSNAIEKFSNAIREAKTRQEKEELITLFYIPNTREDIIEFFLLASSQIDDTNCLEAWDSKLDQVLVKAELLLGDDSKDYETILSQYKKAVRKTKRSKFNRFIKHNWCALLTAFVSICGLTFITLSFVLAAMVKSSGWTPLYLLCFPGVLCIAGAIPIAYIPVFKHNMNKK